MTPKAEGRVQGYLQSELVNGYKTSGQTVLAPDALGAYDMVTVSDGYPPYREFGGRRRAGRVAPHSTVSINLEGMVGPVGLEPTTNGL